MKKAFFILTTLFVFGAMQAHADVLVGWDFTGQPGNEATLSTGDPDFAGFTAENILDSTLSRGAGAPGNSTAINLIRHVAHACGERGSPTQSIKRPCTSCQLV